MQWCFLCGVRRGLHLLNLYRLSPKLFSFRITVLISALMSLATIFKTILRRCALCRGVLSFTKSLGYSLTTCFRSNILRIAILSDLFEHLTSFFN